MSGTTVLIQIGSYCKDLRVDVANAVLRSFAPDTSIRLDAHGYVVVEWVRSNGEKMSRRWMTRGQDWYPVWHRRWAHGGTASVALSQLVRWIQGRPVMSLAAWRHWAAPGCALLRQQGDDGAAAIAALEAAGYPQQAKCVLCGQTGHIGDWWSLNGVSGPCCGMNRGCEQRLPQDRRKKGGGL